MDIQERPSDRAQDRPIYRPRDGASRVLITPGTGSGWEQVVKAHFRPPQHSTQNIIPYDPDEFVAWTRTYPPFVNYFLQDNRQLHVGPLLKDERKMIETSFATVSKTPREIQQDLRVVEELVERFERDAKGLFGVEVVPREPRVTSQDDPLQVDEGADVQELAQAVCRLWVVLVWGPFEIRQSGGHEEVFGLGDLTTEALETADRKVVWI